jgi:hypothetical protein
MRAPRPYFWVDFSLLLIAAVAAGSLLVSHTAGRAQRRTPRTLAELHEAARRAGLNFQPDVRGTRNSQGAFVTEWRMTPDQMLLTRMNNLDTRDWVGKIYVQRVTRSVRLTDPPPTCVWGDLRVYGDPDVIRQLQAVDD